VLGDEATLEREVDPLESDAHPLAEAQLDRHRWIARRPARAALETETDAQAVRETRSCKRPNAPELRERLQAKPHLRCCQSRLVRPVAHDDEGSWRTAQERPELTQAAREFRPRRDMRREVEHDEIERTGQNEKPREFERLVDGLRQSDEKIEDIDAPAVQPIEVHAMRRIEVGNPTTAALHSPDEPASQCPLAGVGRTSEFHQPATKKTTAECEIEPEETGREHPRITGKHTLRIRDGRCAGCGHALPVEQHVWTEALDDELTETSDPLTTGIGQASDLATHLSRGRSLFADGASRPSSGTTRSRHVSPFPRRMSHIRSYAS